MIIKPLKIGNISAEVPIVQGGMGVGISLSNLAIAVANQGGLGVISAAHPGFDDENFQKDSLGSNLKALKKHIVFAKEKSKKGLIGVNIMTALREFDDYVRCCVENKADIIFSGAGLPLNLPSLVKDSSTKIAPIVSSVKAATVLLKMWDNRYKKTADAIVVEGPKAGGHLGFKLPELKDTNNFDNELKNIIEFIKIYENKFGKKIPIIFGGGIFQKSQVEHYLNMGCDAIQAGSIFVTTKECDAHVNFKNAYLNANEDNIGIVRSPLGLPGRALLNKFIEKTTKEGNQKITSCYNCLTPCNPKDTPYCISTALINAAKGDIENGLVFCGENTFRQKKIISVKEVFDSLIN